MLDGVEIDPYVVLGLTRDASFDEVREAYREKSRKHHPDHGGDEWAFRVVVRAYEILSESPRHAPELPAHPQTPEGRVRPGVFDKFVEPRKLVDIEIVWLRYEFADLEEMQQTPMEKRHLSGSLNITWPDRGLAERASEIPSAGKILKLIQECVESLRSRTHPTSARTQQQGGRYEAWLGYRHGQAASDAFRQLHASLKRRGLGVRQSTRDVTVPRPESA
jgi:curved DNA-binding protein CbpA